MTHSSKFSTIPRWAVTIFAAAVFMASPLFGGQALASPSTGVATMLLGKPLGEVRNHFDSVRNRPSHQASLAQTFNERDYYREGRVAALGGDEQTSMFIDMRHDIDQTTETWHGSAGVQILW